MTGCLLAGRSTISAPVHLWLSEEGSRPKLKHIPRSGHSFNTWTRDIDNISYAAEMLYISASCPQMFSPVEFSPANLSPGPLFGPFVTPSLIEGGEECPLRSGKALRGLLESAFVSRFNIRETRAFSSSQSLIQLPGTPGFPPFRRLSR